MSLLEKINDKEQKNTLIAHLENMQSGYIRELAKGLPPAEFKQVEAWIKALDASLKIVKSPKLQVLNP